MAVQVDDERAHVIIGAGVQGCNKQRLRPQVRFWTRIAEDLGDGVVGEPVRDAVRDERERRVAARQAHRAHNVWVGNHARVVSVAERPRYANAAFSTPMSDARLGLTR